MKEELIARVVQVLRINMSWMTWNLFLAFIPLALSVWLFRFRRGSSWLWWLGFLVFYAFLPNAPYLLTDVIHLIDDIRKIQSIWMITLAVEMYLPQLHKVLQAGISLLISFGLAYVIYQFIELPIGHLRKKFSRA